MHEHRVTGRDGADQVDHDLARGALLGLAAGEPVAVGAAVGGELLARDALVELGWSLVDAERALDGVDESLPVEEQVRSALKKAA